MALTRAMLNGMGLTEEQVNAIIEAHSETVDALKEQRDKFKKNSEVVEELQKELETLRSGDWESKYNEEHKSFERYKKDIENKSRISRIKDTYIKLLKETGIGEQFVDSIVGVTDFSGMSIGESGEFENKDILIEDAKKRWSGFIVKDQVKGADVQTPPENGIDMTKEGFFKLSLNEQMNFANSHPAEAREFLK